MDTGRLPRRFFVAIVHIRQSGVIIDALSNFLRLTDIFNVNQITAAGFLWSILLLLMHFLL